MQHAQDWDKLLHIKTSGRDDSKANTFFYPYEPTPYRVLERLANSGCITSKDVLLDYGCGKGRVSFFLSYQTRAKTIGVEYDERLYAKALENKETATSSGRTEFVCADAQEYEVPENVSCCYFFNPFSVEVFHKVLAKIVESYYRTPREIKLFFYYPSDEYMSCLMTESMLEFEDEINCDDLFVGSDARERIMIFRVTG